MKIIKIVALLLALAGIPILIVATRNHPSQNTAPSDIISPSPTMQSQSTIQRKPTIPLGYSLPLDKNAIKLGKGLQYLSISPDDPSLLNNGFVITHANENSSIADFFDAARNAEVPVFVTVDSLLHIQHVLFDSTLAELEEKVFIDYLRDILYEIRACALASANGNTNQLMRNSSSMAYHYAEVAIDLLDGNELSEIDLVSKELNLIYAHIASTDSPLFGYEEDYSQYIPRGHYTKTEALKKYFRAMMWLGRMTFLTKGRMPGLNDAVIDAETAKVHSCAAMLIANSLSKVQEKYQTMYDITSFFVGYSDDLTPDIYSDICRNALSGDPARIASSDGYMRFLAAIAQQQPPAIYSGTGKIEVDESRTLAGEPSPALLDKALTSTTGFRLMGQRFTWDAYILGRLCYPTVGAKVGNAPVSDLRTMVTALDVMAAFGSEEAKNILHEQQLDAYAGYPEALGKLTAEIAALKQEDWTRNAYMSVLDTVRKLLKPVERPCQPFQCTQSWDRRKLNSALGSWTALKHDTILYAKQPYCPGLGLGPGSRVPPMPVAGYVEPEVEIYENMLSANRRLKAYMAKLEECELSTLDRMDLFSDFIEFCIEASKMEMSGALPTDEQLDYLETIADSVIEIMGNDDECSSELIADVFTDSNSGTVLEEATGRMKSMAVVWARPDGYLEVAVGPVYSWEEFDHPMADRLTDEEWQEMLENELREPPVWMKPYYETAYEREVDE